MAEEELVLDIVLLLFGVRVDRLLVIVDIEVGGIWSFLVVKDLVAKLFGFVDEFEPGEVDGLLEAIVGGFALGAMGEEVIGRELHLVVEVRDHVELTVKVRHRGIFGFLDFLSRDFRHSFILLFLEGRPYYSPTTVTIVPQKGFSPN